MTLHKWKFIGYNTTPFQTAMEYAMPLDTDAQIGLPEARQDFAPAPDSGGEPTNSAIALAQQGKTSEAEQAFREGRDIPIESIFK
jgi:hypothetical protein